jgi:D-alanine-D-alanine ligase
LSRERAVSLVTGAAIADALRGEGFAVRNVDAGRDLPAQLDGIDVVYNALHGTYGEDGRVQGLLDWMGIPYTGEGLEASHASFDKIRAKAIMRAAGVPVAEDVVIRAGDLASANPPFEPPFVVKPAAEGSSVGVSIVREAKDWSAACVTARGMGDVIVERFVDGPELSVAILGDTVLGAVEIEPARTFYDYTAKYASESGTAYHLPPRLPTEAVQAAQDAVLRAHQALGCRGVTRSEVIVSADGPIVLEVNTLPGMTGTSLVPKIAASQGIGFGALLAQVLALATHGPNRDDIETEARHGR